jgi:hypothetical protein
VIARFTAISIGHETGTPEAPNTASNTVVEFTLQGQDGRSYKFRQLDFRDFVTRAVELIGITAFPNDTDELLHQWFELDTL